MRASCLVMGSEKLTQWLWLMEVWKCDFVRNSWELCDGSTLSIRSPTINRRMHGQVEPQPICIPLIGADLRLLSVEYRCYRPHIPWKMMFCAPHPLRKRWTGSAPRLPPTSRSFRYRRSDATWNATILFGTRCAMYKKNGFNLIHACK